MGWQRLEDRAVVEEIERRQRVGWSGRMRGGVSLVEVGGGVDKVVGVGRSARLLTH